MTRNKNHALLLASALALCGALLASFTPEASAQAPAAQAPAAQTPQTHKIIKTHFVVEHMLLQSLQVHSVNDTRDLRTFSYSPKIRDKMQRILNAGGYQFGDKVVIWYGRDTELALNIKGRPSLKK
jgi:hypothetical protein